MFLALALAALGSVYAYTWIWLAALIAVLVCRALLPAPDGAAFTPLAAAVAGFAGWLVLTNALINPYTPAAPYYAAFLAFGFLFGRRITPEDDGRLLKAAIMFALALATWSIVQRASGVEARGQALFETPATLASTLNLVLVAGLVAVAAGRRNPWLLGSLVLLAGALVGTASRGGWVALAASALVAAVLFRRAGIALERGALVRVIAILAGGWLLSLITPVSWELAFGTAPKSAGARLDLYQAAWDAMPEGSWLTGLGYLGFRFVLEAARDRIEHYVDAITYFVHNDYLQVLVELGLPGLVLLLLLAALPQWEAWRRLPHIAPGGARLAVLALAAAMASMAIHALVDFPFYIPVCVLIYAVYAGRLSTNSASTERRAPSRLGAAVAAAVGTFAALLLLKPVAAEAALTYANAQLGHNAPRSAVWLEVARRIEPRDWRYHWYLGQFWFHQAQAMRNPAAARLADEAFAAGIAADPRNVPSRLWRITAHVQLRSLLPAPADRATLQRWLDEVATLAPREAGLRGVRRLVEDHLWSGR